MATQIIGATSANIAEVEANTRALRTTLREKDYGALGIYAVGGTSGLMATPLGTNSTIFSFRWAPATAGRLCLIHKVLFSAGCDVTAFAIGLAHFHLRRVVGFSVADSGGTSLVPSGSMNKLRTTGMGTTQVADIRISSTAGLTAGTRTLIGAQTTQFLPLASAMGATQATIGRPLIPPTYLVNRRPGEFPLILGDNQGLILMNGNNTFPATGTWRFSVSVVWQEALSYP